MAEIGYTRVSTSKQTTDQQADALAVAGVEKIFTDTMSGARDDRPGLAALRAYVRRGDVVVVWRLDRLGRSMVQVLQTIEDLRKEGVELRSIHDGIDSTTSTGRMMIGILASLAEYERELIRERASAAREAAAARGKATGRPKALTADQARQLRTLHAGGESVADLCRSFKISRATAYRVLGEPDAA